MVLILCSVVLFRTFIVEIYVVPSQSMAPTLIAGDFILVTKFSYVLRSPEFLPFSDIPIRYFAFPGIKPMRRGDVVVFRSPNIPSSDSRNFGYAYVKRCIGLAKDTVRFGRGRVLLNEVIVDTSMYGLFVWDSSDDTIQYRILAKGDTIKLSHELQQNWSSIVERDGHNIRTDSLNEYRIDGVSSRNYVVEQNYSFMLGDNRLMSSDSRKWGCVPESKIIGQAEIIVWSWSPDIPIADFFTKVRSIRWNRIGKVIE